MTGSQWWHAPPSTHPSRSPRGPARRRLTHHQTGLARRLASDGRDRHSRSPGKAIRADAARIGRHARAGAFGCHAAAEPRRLVRRDDHGAEEAAELRDHGTARAVGLVGLALQLGGVVLHGAQELLHLVDDRR